MAKTKASKKVVKVAAKTRPRARRATADADALDSHAIAAARMLMDPCGADLAPTVYPGDRGYINRFQGIVASAGGAAGETATIWVVKPGVGVAWNAGAALPTTSITVGLADSQFPGAGVTNTYSKMRTAGFCSIIRPNTAVNTATGMIYYGNIPATYFTQGRVFSGGVSDLLGLLTQSVSCAQAVVSPLEVCWSPGAFDDRYCPISGVTSDDDTDRNALVVVCVGMPAATGLNIRNTVIHEWTPGENQAVIDSTSVNPSKCDFNCVLRNLKRKDANWWWRLGTRLAHGAISVLGAYTTGGVGAAAIASAKYL